MLHNKVRVAQGVKLRDASSMGNHWWMGIVPGVTKRGLSAESSCRSDCCGSDCCGSDCVKKGFRTLRLSLRVDCLSIRTVRPPKYRRWFAPGAGKRPRIAHFRRDRTSLLQRYRRCALVPVDPQKRLVHAPRFVTLRPDMSRMADRSASEPAVRTGRSGQPSRHRQKSSRAQKNRTRLKLSSRVLRIGFCRTATGRT